jgi:hypothetical protein
MLQRAFSFLETSLMTNKNSSANTATNTEHSTIPKFELGKIVATPGALEALETFGLSLLEVLDRHAQGDWGESSQKHAKANDLALKTGDQLLSSYQLGDSEGKVWVFTEANRASTCVFLAEEDEY